jgi:hypothetical protein
MESLYSETISRLEVSSELYSLFKKMGGASEVKSKIYFELEKPKIELYEIIDIIQELKKRKGFNSCVYVHLCMDNTYYVGYSDGSYLKSDIIKTDENMMLCRLADHRKNGGTVTPSNMTYLFPVVSCIGFFPGDKEDEDLMTILMSKFAGNNVRGGKWASPFIKPEYPDMTIEEIKNKLLMRKTPS